RDFHVTGVQTCALPICPSDWPATAHITGDWHRSSRDPLCDAELREFIEADAPFVYAGFGSMTGGDASARAEAVIEGARRAGLRRSEERRVGKEGGTWSA